MCNASVFPGLFQNPQEMFSFLGSLLSSLQQNCNNIIRVKDSNTVMIFLVLNMLKRGQIFQMASYTMLHLYWLQAVLFNISGLLKLPADICILACIKLDLLLVSLLLCLGFMSSSTAFAFWYFYYSTSHNQSSHFAVPSIMMCGECHRSIVVAHRKKKQKKK